MPDPTDQILRAVETLKGLVARCSTASVVGLYAVHVLRRANEPDFTGGLLSPARQCSFLLGLLLSTLEPEQPTDMTFENWDRSVGLLNEAFEAYLELFYPTPREEAALTEEWTRVRRVAMPAFLHYFNTALLASPSQIKRRIQTYLAPFDGSLERLTGVTASDALRIADWIANGLQSDLDDLIQRRNEVSRAADLSGSKGMPETEDSYSELAAYASAARNLMESVREFGLVRRAELTASFPKGASAFWDRFAVARGDGPQLTYPTERSIAEIRPLIEVDRGVAMCPSVNTIYSAILLAGEEALERSAERERYLARRDTLLEGEAAEYLIRMVGTDASFYRGVFETKESTYEHDLVVIADGCILIVEAKATPPAEPFRDPDRAFTRLSRAFRSDRGIQKAYDQAARIRRRLDTGEIVPLYDEDGNEVTRLIPQELPDRFCVCVTRDDFGPLATDLALLLEKQDRDPYPWAVNILDLEAIADAWEFFKWSRRELVEYLRARTQAHGKLFSTDELDFLGFCIQHGSLRPALAAPAKVVTLDRHYSDFFDQLYYYKHHGQAAPRVAKRPPVFTDMKESFKRGEPTFVEAAGASAMTGRERNLPCPCGSGKKYKKCCGRKTA